MLPGSSGYQEPWDPSLKEAGGNQVSVVQFGVELGVYSSIVAPPVLALRQDTSVDGFLLLFATTVA